MRAFQLEGQHFVETKDSNQATLILYDNPSQDEMDDLHKKEEIPLDFITDSLNRYMIPRKETFRNSQQTDIQLLLFLYPLIKIDETNRLEYQTLPISIITLEKKVIMIYSKEPPFLKNVLNSNGNYDDSLFILQLLWELTNEYIEAITRIDDMIENMEENIVHTTRNEAFYKMIAINKSLVYFETGITKNHDIIAHLFDHLQEGKGSDAGELLHDIRVLSNQAKVMRKESDEMISHLSEVFSSVISNNLNNIMKFLTSLTIVLTIPTVIGSYWGMNVALPFENDGFAFLLLVGVSIILGILTVFWLKKKDYL